MPAACLFAADQAALSASQVKGTSIGGWPLRYSRTSESDRVRPGGAQSSPPHAAQPELTARREALEDVLRRDQLTWLTAPGAAGGGYVASQGRAHRFAVDRPQGGKSRSGSSCSRRHGGARPEPVGRRSRRGCLRFRNRNPQAEAGRVCRLLQLRSVSEVAPSNRSARAGSPDSSRVRRSELGQAKERFVIQAA